VADGEKVILSRQRFMRRRLSSGALCGGGSSLKFESATVRNGWFFPFISQAITMNYEGLSSYRATAIKVK